jgi:hypothetical protein
MRKSKQTLPAAPLLDSGPAVAARLLPRGRPTAFVYLIDGGLWVRNDLGQTFKFAPGEVAACLQQWQQEMQEARRV